MVGDAKGRKVRNSSSRAREGKGKGEGLTTPNLAARAFFFSISAALAAAFSSAVRTGAAGAAGSTGVGAGGAGMAAGGAASEVEGCIETKQMKKVSSLLPRSETEKG